MITMDHLLQVFNFSMRHRREHSFLGMISRLIGINWCGLIERRKNVVRLSIELLVRCRSLSRSIGSHHTSQESKSVRQIPYTQCFQSSDSTGIPTSVLGIPDSHWSNTR